MSDSCSFSLSRRPIQLAPGLVCQAFWFVLFYALPCAGQSQPPQGQPPNPGQLSQHIGRSQIDYGEAPPIEEEKRLRILNAERQKSMVSDAQKLLKLANELNTEIAQANSDTVTPAQLRKVAEIEKLARSVKEKMSTSVRGTPVFQEPLPFR